MTKTTKSRSVPSLRDLFAEIAPEDRACLPSSPAAQAEARRQLVLCALQAGLRVRNWVGPIAFELSGPATNHARFLQLSSAYVIVGTARGWYEDDAVQIVASYSLDPEAGR